MKIFKYLCLVAVVTLLVFSCKKEQVSKTIGESSQRIVGTLGHVDYIQSELNDIDQVKVRFAKILSNAISKNPSLKQMLFEVLFDEESKSSEEVFILDLIETKSVSLREETIRDLLLTDGGVTEDEFLDLENTFCQDYPNLAIDVPAYVEMAYSSDKTRDNFVSTYQNYPFVIMPNTHEPNLNGTWTGYGDLNQDESSHIYEIPSGGTYQDAIPFIIKASERKLLLTDDLTLINGRNIIESYLGNGYDAELIQCFIQQIGEKKAAKVLCGQEYNVLLIDDIITIQGNCNFLPPPPPPEEICDDGIDNDDDGLIDCEDPDCNCEICDDGIDNDGDGLIDAEDPDCNPDNLEICCDGIDNDGDGDIDEADSDCCYRDCREDHNILLVHKFRDLINVIATLNSQVPGGERITQIKYEITSLEKDCPTCLPVAVHSTQIVTAHTYRLVCNENTMESNPWDVLSPEDYSTLCVSSGSLESSISHPAFISGAAFDSESNLLDYYDDGEVYFELTENIFILLTKTSPVKTPILYLRSIKDWDASLIANEVRLSMYEVDEVESSSGGGTSVQVTNTHVVSGKFGAKFKLFVEANAEVSYSFTNQTQNTATTSYSITAKHIYELGDLSLNYCDQENYQQSFYSSTLAEHYQTDGLFHHIDAENGNLIWLDVIEDLD